MTVQGPVKKQQPDGMSHKRGAGVPRTAPRGSPAAARFRAHLLPQTLGMAGLETDAAVLLHHRRHLPGPRRPHTVRLRVGGHFRLADRPRCRPRPPPCPGTPCGGHPPCVLAAGGASLLAMTITAPYPSGRGGGTPPPNTHAFFVSDFCTPQPPGGFRHVQKQPPPPPCVQKPFEPTSRR